jgi:hypothetical protein
VKQHLLHLYDKFAIAEGGERRRVSLARAAIGAKPRGRASCMRTHCLERVEPTPPASRSSPPEQGSSGSAPDSTPNASSFNSQRSTDLGLTDSAA